MPFKEDELKLMSHDELGSIFFATDMPCKIWQYTSTSSFVLRANLTKTNTDAISESQLQSRMNTINDCIVYYDNQNQCYLIRGDWAPLLINTMRKSAGVLGDKQFIFYDDSLKTYLTIDSLGNKSKLSNTSVVASTNMNLVNYIGPSQLFKSEQYNYYLLKENQWIEIFNAIEQKNLGYFGVPSYCEDRNGNYWLCTDKGVYQVNIRKNQFEHLFSNALFNQIGNAPVRNIYVDQNGNTATILKDNNGHTIIKINYQGNIIILTNNLPNGEYTNNDYNNSNYSNYSNSINDSSSLNNIDKYTSYNTDNNNNNVDDNNITNITPNNNSKPLITNYDSSSYYNSKQGFNNGVHASNIPKGSEDLYILKSQIVPPVCPVCPSPIVKNCDKSGKCPPCPAPQRCPSESDFICKKEPNYQNINSNVQKMLPQPVLNSFSSFGM
jgi:hypothetical protein